MIYNIILLYLYVLHDVMTVTVTVVTVIYLTKSRIKKIETEKLNHKRKKY